jgi:outer membrane protein OmpA-like peptidoglycan-associated protein
MMVRNRRFLTLCVCLLALSFVLVSADTATAADDKVRVEGIVSERDGNRVVVKDSGGASHVVLIQSDTRIRERKKNFLREALTFAPDDVVVGLRVLVRGTQTANGEVSARRIKFRKHDLDLARVLNSRLMTPEAEIDTLQAASSRLGGQVDELNQSTRENQEAARQAGEVADNALVTGQQAQQQIAAHAERLDGVDRRFGDLGYFDVSESLVIQFEAGSAKLSDEATAQLDTLANSVPDSGGFLIEVRGFASSDGSEELNRRLSQKRAEAVMQYLKDKHTIGLRHFISPHGFGESMPTGDNDTREGRMLNRRAEVKILLPRVSSMNQ